MSGPAASPEKLATAAVTAPAFPRLLGCSSAIQAVNVLDVRPVAKPLSARAANSQAVPLAKPNVTALSMPMPIAGHAVILRPIWSDSLAKKNSAARLPST
jgi:hypothetical protein